MYSIDIEMLGRERGAFALQNRYVATSSFIHKVSNRLQRGNGSGPLIDLVDSPCKVGFRGVFGLQI